MILDKKPKEVCTSSGGVFCLGGLANSKESERQGKMARDRQISEDKRTKTGTEELLMRQVWNRE